MMLDDEDGRVTWKRLEAGCAFGRGVIYRVEQVEDDVAEACKKLDRLTWALVAAALTFGTSAVFLALNLLW